MSLFMVEEYLVKRDKQGEFKALMQRLLVYKKENSKLSKEVKSFRLFHQMFGGLAAASMRAHRTNYFLDKDMERC